MTIVKKIVEYITNILLVIVIIAIFFALYGFFQLKILNKTYINYFGYTFFEVVSGSMSPTINVHDLIIVKIDNEVKEDDIVTFYKDNAFITHRVIEYKSDDNILTKGDANNTIDKSISKNEVLGKVVKVIPKFGMIKVILSDIKVIASLVLTILLFALAFSLNPRRSKDEENKN